MSALRVVVAVPFDPDHISEIRAAEPRLELVHEPDLVRDAASDTHARAEFESLLASADALLGVPGHAENALSRIVDRNEALRWVHTIPAGGGEQVAAAGLAPEPLARITFTTSAGVHAAPLAEFAVFGVVAGAKRLGWLMDLKSRRDWAPRRALTPLSELTVGILGMGSIGRATADLLAPLGCRVIGIQRSTTRHPSLSDVAHPDDLEATAARLDALVVALPATAATRGMVSRRVLGNLRAGATVVNVGRGVVIDEDALVDHLDDGRVGLAVLDVTTVEPLPAEHPLWACPNALIAPHTAAYSETEPRLIAALFAENARRLLDGEPLRNRVDVHEFY